MRLLRISSLLLLSLAAYAAETTIKVVDPQSLPVAGARVSVLRAGRVVSVANTSASGEARLDTQGGDEIEVLAPGFAAKRVAGTPSTIQLEIASPSEQVLVTATRIPLALDDSGASGAAINSAQIESMQPFSAGELIRFAPGAVLSNAGRRGGQTSLFVRGGESRYNKVLIDGVPVNDPGGSFDFGVWPMDETERVEFVRGAQSTLYGSDAMTSVVQTWSRSGATHMPELRFGAEGGTFATGRGFASVAGARGRVDYNVFGEQANSDGQGPNDAYSNSSQGANLGVVLARAASLRLRARHANSRSGVQSFWKFNGQPLLSPDLDQRARQNNFLASAELNVTAPGAWQHRLAVYEYNHRRSVTDNVQEPGRTSPSFGNFDFPFSDFADINRAGGDYQADWSARAWARSTFGYSFEVENGFAGDKLAAVTAHGVRRNQGLFAQQVLTLSRVSLVAGVRWAHWDFGGTRSLASQNTALPRVAASAVLWRGRGVFGETRVRGSYAQGLKQPRLEESFGIGGFGITASPDLKAERNRSWEAGLQQAFRRSWWLNATYFRNRFDDQIAFSFDPATFTGKYVNVNRALAHGAELELQGRPMPSLSVQTAYVYTSTQILAAPFAFDPLLAKGAPLLRRPRHSGTVLATWTRARWGANVGGSFLGRRPDSDFSGLVPPVTYAAGYGRVDLGGWYALNSRVTAYANVENALNRHYEEAAGYPGLRANFRAGVRFRFGGD